MATDLSTSIEYLVTDHGTEIPRRPGEEGQGPRYPHLHSIVAISRISNRAERVNLLNHDIETSEVHFDNINNAIFYYFNNTAHGTDISLDMAVWYLK